MRTINEIIWHCTATPEGRHHTVDDIRHWHTAPPPQGNGWSDIGYHEVIYIDGSRHAGRSYEIQGAHVGSRNANSLGFVYVGGTDAAGAPKDTRNAAQKAEMEALTAETLRRYSSINLITGHYEYDNKACPCFNPSAEYAHLLTQGGVPAETITLAERNVELFKYPSYGQFVEAVEGGVEFPLRPKEEGLDNNGLFTSPIGGQARWYCVMLNGQEAWVHEQDVVNS